MKKIYMLIFSLFLNLIFLNQINASNANISVYTNKSLVIVGDTVNITVKINSSSNLGSWNFDVVPSSNLSLVSSSFGGLYITDFAQSKGEKSKTYTFKFKSKSSGLATVSIKNVRVIDFDTEKNMSVNSGSTSFKMMTRSQLESTYSKNNNLTNLSVDNYEITPKFDKDVLEYKLDLEYGTKNININAKLEDSRASLIGTGITELAQGLNVIKIIVTAQNGTTKTYTLNVNVLELDPINIKLDNQDYTVIREKQFLPQAGILYHEKIIKINDKDVPAYYNEASGFTLVGLKDKNGDSKLYIYNDGIYKKYEDYTVNSMTIYFLPMDESILPKDYHKIIININNKKVEAYKNENNEFPIIYGLNLETGNKNLYKYDEKENTLQRYENNPLNNEKLYFNMMIGMTGFIIISYIMFIVNNKKKKNVLLSEIPVNINDISTNSIEEILNIKTKKELKKARKLAKKNKKSKKEEDMAEL